MIGKTDIILAGVGGQGTLVAGKLLGQVATAAGLQVKVSEVHGMAQRGGSVVTYVRMGEHVFSPVIEPGSADAVLAFETLEALRWAHLLRTGGSLIVNRRRITPLTVALGAAQYPEDIVEQLRRQAAGRAQILELDAERIAVDSGSSRAVNIVLSGALSSLFDWPETTMMDAVRHVFAPRLQAINERAMLAGREAAAAHAERGLDIAARTGAETPRVR